LFIPRIGVIGGTLAEFDYPGLLPALALRIFEPSVVIEICAAEAGMIADPIVMRVILPELHMIEVQQVSQAAQAFALERLWSLDPSLGMQGMRVFRHLRPGRIGHADIRLAA
jgi:hypothetical protein